MVQKIGFVFLVLALSPLGATASETAIHCEAIKASGSSPDLPLRGLSITHREPQFDTHGNGIGTRVRAEREIWFGPLKAQRDKAGAYCQLLAKKYTCAPDGPSHTSYGRGGYQATSQDWALRRDGAVVDTFSDPPFAFMDSAYENCYDSILDRIVSAIGTLTPR